jgi:predicted Zn-dependent protease with MMP-like domain
VGALAGEPPDGRWTAPPERGDHYHRGVTIGRDDFEDLVAEAMDAIPEPFASALDEVAVVVEEHARGDMGPLYGLYIGVPLTEGGLPSGILPARIAIYMHPLIDHYPHRPDMVEQVRITVLHELGHHLGFDEDELEDLGYA